MRRFRKKNQETSLVNTNETMVEIPLEQEVARMKREKMPIRGGATPIYGGEDGEVLAECDYRVGRLETARLEMSRVVQERIIENQQAQIKGEAETGANAEE